MYVDSQTTQGGAWAVLDEHSRIVMRVEADERYTEFSFLGSVEMSLNMPEEMVLRFRDMCTEALARMSAVETP